MDDTNKHDEEFDYKMKLEQHHLDIVQCLDLDRHFILSHLRSKHILDDEDSQIIRSGTSRQQKAEKFIDVLTTKGPNGFSHFMEALEIEYPHLYETITGIEAVNKGILIYFSMYFSISFLCSFIRSISIIVKL